MERYDKIRQEDKGRVEERPIYLRRMERYEALNPDKRGLGEGLRGLALRLG